MIVTTRLKQIWELILKKAGLSSVKVISSSRISDRLVVNAEVKAAMVTQFKEHELKTIAIGDSTLDLEMLKIADRAVIVVGGRISGGSKSMKKLLGKAIDMKLLKAEQTLLLSTASYLIDPKKLLVVDLKAARFVTDIFALKDKDGAKTIYLINITDRVVTNSSNHQPEMPSTQALFSGKATLKLVSTSLHMT
jgi:hypothetical protein